MELIFNNEEAAPRLKELIRCNFGLTFSAEREHLVISALRRRMDACKCSVPDDYYALLHCNRNELLNLAELLTVNETYFLREPEHLLLAVDTLIPDMLARRRSVPLRILSAGCSSGEEPYSIALLLLERYGTQCERLFSIHGVDIDSKMIALARQGKYSSSSFRGMSTAQCQRFFKPLEDGSFQICQQIHQMVSFATVNLFDNAHPLEIHKADMILYRNVSIYFPQDVQQHIFGRLAGLLHKDGAIVVGAAETLHHDTGILTLVEQNGLFYYRKLPGGDAWERRSSNRTSDQTSTTERRNSIARQLMPDPQLSTKQPVHAAPAPGRRKRGEPPAGEESGQLLDLAFDKTRSGHFDQALELLDSLLQRDGSIIKALELKAGILLNISKIEEARRTSEAMLAQDSFSREACLILGIIARHEGDNSAAFKRFREALYIDSGCWLAHFYSAEILYARQECKRARKSYETTLTLLDGLPAEGGEQLFFPLSCNIQQYISICRHKLLLLKENP